MFYVDWNWSKMTLVMIYYEKQIKISGRGSADSWQLSCQAQAWITQLSISEMCCAYRLRIKARKKMVVWPGQAWVCSIKIQITNSWQLKYYNDRHECKDNNLKHQYTASYCTYIILYYSYGHSKSNFQSNVLQKLVSW